jgi:rod shape-determining protein MreC
MFQDWRPLKKVTPLLLAGNSVIFPENIGIGTIDKIYIDNKTNYYTLNVKLFNDMTNLGHVYIIKSKDREEILTLEKKEDE